MSGIRPEFLNKVVGALSRPPKVVQADFDIAEQDLDGYSTVEIRYALQPELSFWFRVPWEKAVVERTKMFGNPLLGMERTREREIEFRCLPGELTVTETGKVSSGPSLVNEIGSWLDRLIDFTSKAPVQRILDDHTARLRELEESLRSVPNNELTADEIREIKANLERMVSELQAEVEELKATDRELSATLSGLADQLAALGPRVERMSRKQVVRALWSRVVGFVSDPRTERALSVAEKTVKLLTAAADKST